MTEYFTYGALNPATVALLQGAINEQRAWQAGLQRQGLTVQDLNPTDECMEGQIAEMKGDNDAALTAFLRRADDLLERDRRKLSDEQARGAFMDDKLDCYYRPALMLLESQSNIRRPSLFSSARVPGSWPTFLSSGPLTMGSDKERDLFSQLQILRTTIAAQQEKLFYLISGQGT